MQEISENRTHVQGGERQNVPTVSTSRVFCPYLMGYIMRFLMHIWEFRRKVSEDEMLQQFIVGRYGKRPMLPSVRDRTLRGSPGKGSSVLKFPCAFILVTLRQRAANRAVLSYNPLLFS